MRWKRNEWLFKLNLKMWEVEIIQSGWKPVALNVFKCYNVSAFSAGVSGLAWKCSTATFLAHQSPDYDVQLCWSSKLQRGLFRI